jgi:CHAD domain-containing protein
MATSAVQTKRIGLGHWMQQVREQAERAADGFRSEPVHDLRTSLRRCRSIADGLMVFDANPAWRKMRKAGKQLFQSLGVLRDTHVLREWIEKLSPEPDPAAANFTKSLDSREQELRLAAAIALQQFDRSKWTTWSQQLPARAERIPLDSSFYAHLALERWHQAHALHQRALRNRTNVAFHDLRIGIKRFRYTIENFLPSLYEFWSADLKEVQDALGDVHDLDVLWATALTINAFPEPESRKCWRDRILEKRHQCLAKYRAKMVGKDSLWSVWRAALPKPEQARALASQRLEIWASSLDPDVAHSKHVARLAVQIFDGLSQNIERNKRDRYRGILQAAALMHNVGLSKQQEGHHKRSARLIRSIKPPLGWSSDELRLASLVARYHRGALPSDTQKCFSTLCKSKQWLVQFLGGVLRLACACDSQHDTQIRRVDVELSDPVLRIRAEGYREVSSHAEHLAAARHLLEIAYRRPVFISSARDHAA